MPQRLAQHLIARGLLPARVVDEALRRVARDGGSLDTVLLEQGAVSEAGILQAISDVSGVRLVNLADFEPNHEAGPLMPLKMARQLNVVPLSVDGTALHVACAYPLQQAQLKDVGFLLGRKLELWMAIECRVRDWQHVLYGQKPEPRYLALLSQLDPSRPKVVSDALPGSETETLSREVLDRVTQGIVDEPVLLDRPKKKPAAVKPKPKIEIVEEPMHLGDEVDEPRTSVLDPTAYSRFARAEHGKGLETSTAGVPLEEHDSTRVLDITGYKNFAKLSVSASAPVASAAEAPPPPPRISAFPGGVLPPRRSPGEPAPARRPAPAPTFVQPALAPRPISERVRPGERRAVSKPALPPAPAPAAPAPAPADEMDFSDVNVAITAPPPEAEVPPEPPTPPDDERRAMAEAPAPLPPPEPLPEPVTTEAASDDLADAVAAAPLLSPDTTPEPVRGDGAAPGWATPPDDANWTQPVDAAAVAAAGAWADAPPQAEQQAWSDATAQAPADAAWSDATAQAPADAAWSDAAAQAPVDAQAWSDAAAQAPVDAQAWSDAAAQAPVDAQAWSDAAAQAPVDAQQPAWGQPSLDAGTPLPAPSAPSPSLALAQAQGLLPSPPGLSASPATEWNLAQARASLRAAVNDREQLITVVLDYAQRTFEFAGAFAIMRGAAVGWDSRGDERQAIRQLAIPLDASSVFRTVALTRGSYVGPLPPDALSQHYLALLGRAPRTVFVWPVEVQSKLVAMLYGDCGTRPISQRRLSDFILFCQDLPSAFHELILFRKQNPQAAQHFTSASAIIPDPGYAADVPPEAQPSADEEWFGGLIQLLTGPDPSERSMAMMELMKAPDAAAQALARAFPGPSGWSRLPVAELPEPDELGPLPGAMARLGQAGASALAPLLEHPDSDTRYLALLTAGSLRYPDVVDGVLRGLFDFEPDISSAARAAAAALKRLPHFQSRFPALRGELASSDPLQASLAARALGVLHDRQSIEGLIELTASPDDLCAHSASDALKEITRAGFGNDTAAWQAWWAQAQGRRRIEWLVEALEADDFDLRLAAVEELSRTFHDNFGYFADGPDAERTGAVARWRAIVASRPDLDL